MSTVGNEEAILEKLDNKGIITLNRPKALNALNLNMIKLIYPQMKAWSSNVSCILICGVGGKAFCAGGDVLAVTEAGKKGDVTAHHFFKEEYKLNYLIGTLTVPYIALIDGITMGGGVGLSVHGKYRVATEKTLFAMPETAIGLFPDVGGSYFLSRLKNLGVYLALTGFRLKGVDVLKAGIATHFCDSAKIGNLKEDLIKLPDVNKIPLVLESYTKQSLGGKPQEFILKPHMEKIDKLFSGQTVEEIISSLELDSSEWAKTQKDTLNKMSPTSLKITLRMLQDGGQLDLKNCLKMEYRMVLASLRYHDFYEGVRAVLVDRDNNPKWNPSRLEDVTAELVDSYFAQVPLDQELKL